MYDNIDFVLGNEEAKIIDFLNFLPNKLSNFDILPNKKDGSDYLIGNLDSLNVSAKKDNLYISNNSICKFVYGNNFQTMTRAATKQTIEKISDLLGLPFQQSKIYRIDFAENFEMTYPVSVYFNHLGNLQYLQRLDNGTSLYYQKGKSKNIKKKLIFYDKIAESKDKYYKVPEYYQHKNILRYEIKFLKRLKSQFRVSDLRAKDLYEEKFYNELKGKWFESYQQINKLRDINLDFNMVKTKTDYTKQSILYRVTATGGILQELKSIKEAQAKGLLSNKQAFDIRKLLKAACQNELMTTQNDCIEELNSKIEYSFKHNE